MHKPKSIQENETHTIFLDFKIQIDTQEGQIKKKELVV